MKILHISTSDRGGAGIAAVRLHEALLGSGVESKLLTLIKHETDIKEHYVYHCTDVARFPSLARLGVLINRVLKRLKIKSEFYTTFRKKNLEGRPKGYDAFSFAISEHRLERHPLIAEADIVHLHWVCDGLIDFSRFFAQVSKKIIWTLHDMNPFTGGCHHADACERYMTDCGGCPQLKNTPDDTLAKKMLSIKAQTLEKRKDALTIVTPSKWLMHCSERSALFRAYSHYQICNVVEDDAYYVTDKDASREELSLPTNKKIILCVAHNVDNPRKGYGILLAAMQHMHTADILLCTVGSIAKEWQGKPSIVQLGYIKESSKMREVYNAADTFVLPSMAENFPNTIVESQLCGTPVVAFGVGGITEQINEHNGLIVEELNAKCLAATLDRFFEHADSYDRQEIAKSARSEYASKETVDAHEALYQTTMGCSVMKSGA